MIWQRKARLVIAVAAAGFAVAVALAFRPRPVPPRVVPVVRTDPSAVVESASGRTLRMNRGHEEIRIDYDRLLTYADGSSKMFGVTVVTERAGGRSFTVKGDEAVVSDREANVSVTGNVRITSADGMRIRTQRATYTEADGIVRAPGGVSFAHERTTGTGLGLTYDKNLDVLVILEAASVRVKPDGAGEGLLVEAGTAVYDRPTKVIRFDRMVTGTRGGETIEADAGVAHLTEDAQRLTALELRGHSRVTSPSSGSGGLQALQGRDIDIGYAPDGGAIEHAVIAGDALLQFAGDGGRGGLQALQGQDINIGYAPGGRTIEHAVIGGGALIQFSGDGGRAGRQISATSMDIVLAADGVTPKTLVAREAVQLALPGDEGSAARTVTAAAMDGRGEAGRGLTTAHFVGDVQYRERGAGAALSARSGVLDTKMAPGGAIDEADFTRAVRFEQGDLKAEAANARYVIARNELQLSGSEPGTVVPHMDNARIVVDAARITVTLAGPKVDASGTVKSLLRPARKDGPQETKVPSMLESDQPVNVIGDRLEYDGPLSLARYTGNAQLWQGDTTIKGSTIAIDGKRGDLNVAAAATHTMLVGTGADQQKARTASTGTANTFVYEEALHRATYTGQAHLIGVQGDVTAAKIELYFKASGNELDRLEAYDTVVLREERRRKTTGSRLTYFTLDERFIVAGTPVNVLDECGREMIGRTLTFYRTTDRIMVDGNEQVRTQTKGASNCR